MLEHLGAQLTMCRQGFSHVGHSSQTAAIVGRHCSGIHDAWLLARVLNTAESARLSHHGLQQLKPRRNAQASHVLPVAVYAHRCCVHTDLEASSDSLMLQLSSGNKKGSQGQLAKKADTAPGVHAQLRSRDSSGRLVVQFGSAAATGAALADAAVVEVIVRNSAVHL